MDRHTKEKYVANRIISKFCLKEIKQHLVLRFGLFCLELIKTSCVGASVWGDFWA